MATREPRRSHRHAEQSREEEQAAAELLLAEARRMRDRIGSFERALVGHFGKERAAQILGLKSGGRRPPMSEVS